jgi:hypothetical protein
MAPLAALSSGTTPYVRRRPELSPLYQLVLQHLESFVASEDVPAFAVRALRKFLTCGVLSEGFARVRCPECHEENLVAFSCKDRGFCPSCMSRRAAQTAASPARGRSSSLIDFVLPSQPLRQWVFVLPFDLHARVSRDPALESAVLGLFIEELTAHLRAVTGTEEPLGQAGSISFSQKFGSSVNLHVHWHVLALDGVYTRDTDAAPLRFVRAPPPTVEHLEQLVQRVAVRVRELVGRAGPEPDLPEVQAPLLRVYGTEPAESVESVTPKLVASCDGFNLHAATAFEGHERMAIERWCRYALVPKAGGCALPLRAAGAAGGEPAFPRATQHRGVRTGQTQAGRYDPAGLPGTEFSPTAVRRPAPATAAHDCVPWGLPTRGRSSSRLGARLAGRGGRVGAEADAAGALSEEEAMDRLGRPSEASVGLGGFGVLLRWNSTTDGHHPQGAGRREDSQAPETSDGHTRAGTRDAPGADRVLGLELHTLAVDRPARRRLPPSPGARLELHPLVGRLS